MNMYNEMPLIPQQTLRLKERQSQMAVAALPAMPCHSSLQQQHEPCLRDETGFAVASQPTRLLT